MFFISHRSNDNAHALKLYEFLKRMNPEWEIFLDCSDKRPLESSVDWYEELMKNVKASKYLIVIASEAENLKSTYVIDEIKKFRDDFENSQRYFGIFFSEQEFNKVLAFSETFNSYFKWQENLLLGEGETLDDAEERLKVKIVKMMNEAESENSETAEILDKVKKFAVEKEQNDPMFSEKAIDEGLIPILRNKEKIVDFEMLCDSIEKTNIAIIGTEGGCGKTTLLTKIFYHYLNNVDISDPNSMIPIYIDAKNLSAENFLILRWITKILHDEQDAMTSKSTSDKVGKLIKEFSKKTEKPRYLLMLDGYNEIPNGMIEKFNKELLDFLPDGRYSNIRLVLSGRYVDENFSEMAFDYLKMQNLNKWAIERYLAEKGHSQKINDSLVKILSIPMYLKIYAETSVNEQITSKADLLCKFVDWQEKKDAKIDESDTKKKLYSIFLRYALPIIAHGMAMGESSFILTKAQFSEIVVEILDKINGREYKEHFGSEYVGLVRNSGLRNMDEYDLEYDLKEYMVSVCAMLRCDKDDNFMFVHQIYRDFFCAQYISTEIKRSVATKKCSDALAKRILVEDIVEFSAELLKESAPFFDNEKGVWDYSCNNTSYIVRLLDVVRIQQGENSAKTIANLIKMLSLVRRMDLSNLDLSSLDLTESKLSTCYLYRYDKTGRYSTSFVNSKINRDNLFAENHFYNIVAACTNKDTIVCVDEKGFIKFWEKRRGPKFPKKILTDANYSISRIFFSNENDRLFAMTEHEIIEIAIPDEFLSKAKQKVIFKTAKRLREMKLGENNEIFFTTNLNPFNFKSILAPNTLDECNFYGINSTACVNSQCNRLAFGHIAGYECLKIYDRNIEKNTWEERKYGYLEILNNFMLELEETFVKMKLYHKFETDNKYYDKRRTFFSYVQQQFEDGYVNLEAKPAAIVKRCRSSLERNKVTLYPWQNAKLDALVEKYQQIIKEKIRENHLLMMISGRKITGVNFKKDTNTVLISCALDTKEKFKKIKTFEYDPSRRYKCLVIELNTDTFETHYITAFDTSTTVRAFYCGDDIITVNNRCLVVYDADGGEISRLIVTPKVVNSFIAPENKETFYAISSNFIYEFDDNLRCVCSNDNIFKKYSITYNVNDQGEEYFAIGASLSSNENNDRVLAQSIENGSVHYIADGGFTKTKYRAVEAHGNLKFKVCSDKIVSFENDVKKDEVQIPFKLFVCGCDFRGVEGNVNESGYINLLNRYGAITDDDNETEILIDADIEGFTPSSADFVVPEGVDERYVVYSCRPKQSFVDECKFSSATGGDNLYEQKIWALINNRTYSSVGLESADYSILEWVNSLVFATPNMIEELVEAGLIEKPVGFSDVNNRVKSLHKSFKFLFRSRFAEDGVIKGVPVYTVNCPFGKTLLEEITHKDITDPLTPYRVVDTSDKKVHGMSKWSHISISGGSMRVVRAQMALNQWFTLAACRYKDYFNDSSLDSIFDTDNHFNGRARIHCYVLLGDQPFFVQEYRKGDVGFDKVERMCIIATHHRSAVRYDKQLSELAKKPVIVLVCESFEHCKEIDSQIKDVYPHVRKIYTYDTLVCSKEAFEGAGNHFEFVDGVPYSVKLEDIFKTE